MAPPTAPFRELLRSEIVRARSSMKQCSRLLGHHEGWMSAFLKSDRSMPRADRQLLARFLGSSRLGVAWHPQDPD